MNNQEIIKLLEPIPFAIMSAYEAILRNPVNSAAIMNELAKDVRTVLDTIKGTNKYESILTEAAEIVDDVRKIASDSIEVDFRILYPDSFIQIRIMANSTELIADIIPKLVPLLVGDAVVVTFIDTR